MEDLYTILALLTAGLSLAVGSISFFIGLKTRNKTDLIFGFMGFSLLIFFLFPPLGFILVDHAPYSPEILFKRIFIHTYYALIPWFALYYTGYGKKKWPVLINAIVIACYIIMFMTTENRSKPIWSMFAVAGFGSILIYGLIAGIWQYRNKEKEKAKWFILAMTIYGVLFLLTAINQLSNNALERALNMRLFFPMHFHSLLFMLIMGLRVVADVFEKYRLEKVLTVSNQRWQSFMQNAPIIVIELNIKGNIVYINDFGVRLLGFKRPGELIGQNWFDTFEPSSDSVDLKSLYEKIMQETHTAPPYFKNSIRTKTGKEITISWVNFLTYSENAEIFSIVSIGCDITEGENANKLIHQLKLEIEKEKITFAENKGIVMPDEIIGKSEAIAYAVQKAQQVASTHAPVLLEGETGVGKDLMADVIHKNSSRNNMPMIKVNCGALPKELIEDELFGHEKGAFTSAIQARKGRFELADGGTIFLDEIGELPLEMQPKLLRVLQNGEFERVGGQKTIKVNVRVIAATNRDLSHEVLRGRFRDDLYYRLNVFPITIPPLRKRNEDLPELINYFIARKCQKYGKKLEHISRADMQRLIEYHWPGNVRELKNVIERSVITSNGDTLRLDWFFVQQELLEASHLTGTLEQIEKDHILKIMEACHWKINGENGAAEKLAMHPNTLRSKMKKLGISRPQREASESFVKDEAD